MQVQSGGLLRRDAKATDEGPNLGDVKACAGANMKSTMRIRARPARLREPPRIQVSECVYAVQRRLDDGFP
jgi:hypothetical protein